MTSVMDRLYLELASVVSLETKSNRELKLEAEIERLRAIKARLESELLDMTENASHARSDVKRLTKEVDRLQEDHEIRDLSAELGKEEMQEFIAENERLRKALEWYAGDGSTYDGIDVGQRAREALKGGAV